MTEGWEEFSNYVIEDFEDGSNLECFGFPTGFRKTAPQVEEFSVFSRLLAPILRSC